MIIQNPGQVKLRAIIKDKATKYILARGGTGSGKTFEVMNCMIDRAISAPGSYHLCLRSTATDARLMLMDQTTRAVIDAKFSNEDGTSAWELLRDKGKITYDPMIITLDTIGPDGKPGAPSRIRFAGLDDNKLDRVLGADYATIFINEVSLIDRFEPIETLKGRLRQKITNAAGNELSLKFIFDCNPPSKRHWTYKAFSEGINPATGMKHKKPEQWRSLHMFGIDNAANLGGDYLEDLEDSGYIARKRFVEGEWFDDVDNPMFHSESISTTRKPPAIPGQTDFKRIVVAVDPAVSTEKGSDETGIVVVAVDYENHGYVLEDLSGKYTAPQWGEIAVLAYKRWLANEIVAEKNQGGNMVLSTIRTVDEFAPVILIHASQGKEIRAEGTSTAYKQLRVHHCGVFRELEDQLLSFEVGFNRRLKGSPDRLDALVHGFNAILVGPKEKKGTMRAQEIDGFWLT